MKCSKCWFDELYSRSGCEEVKGCRKKIGSADCTERCAKGPFVPAAGSTRKVLYGFCSSSSFL